MRDYSALLRLAGGYTVVEMPDHPGNWMARKRLDELDLPDEGVVVLGIERADGSFVGASRGHSMVHPHDTLILYGLAERLAEIDERQAGSGGDRAHQDAVRAQQRVLHEQERQEHASEEKGRALDGRRPSPRPTPRG